MSYIFTLADSLVECLTLKTDDIIKQTRTENIQKENYSFKQTIMLKLHT